MFVRIGEKRAERQISVPVPGTTGKTATAILYGPKTVLAKIKPADIKVEIIKDESGNEVPRFDLPPEIEVRNPKIK